MNKVINGKMYNTETAKEICERFNLGRDGQNYSGGDVLYKKKTGEFFIFTYTYDSYATFKGEKRNYITPISEAEAKKFAEEELSGEEYISVFGEVEE